MFLDGIAADDLNFSHYQLCFGFYRLFTASLTFKAQCDDMVKFRIFSVIRA